MCAVGEVTSCSCDAERLELPTGDTEKQYTRGCSDNVGFGINFATQFLHRRQSGVGYLQEIERENMQIGARVSATSLSMCTVEPLNNGHVETSHFTLYKVFFLLSEVKKDLK